MLESSISDGSLRRFRKTDPWREFTRRGADTIIKRNLGRKQLVASKFQVTSHPVQRNFVRLKITEAYSIIPGAPDLHVKQGSSLRLECQLMAAAESPLYVFWYRQGRMINYDEEPGVKVELTKSGSILMVNKTKPSHSGNYTCEPSNAKPAYVVVHVIEGEPNRFHFAIIPFEDFSRNVNDFRNSGVHVSSKVCTIRPKEYATGNTCRGSRSSELLLLLFLSYFCKVTR